jgi:probable O-glycosylation ligase (exosortase A-associated)
MRSMLVLCEMALLLPMVAVRPFVGVLLWEWISFMNPHRLVWGVASDLPWAAMVFCVTILGCVLAREPKRLPLNATAILIVLFMALISLTSVVALAPPADVMEKWSLVFKTSLFLLITMALLTDRYRIHAVIWMIVISLGYFGVRGGGFAIMTAGDYRVFGPPSTMIEDNNHLAAALLVTLPLMNYLRMQSQDRIVRLALAMAMVLTLLSVVASYSRGALLGLGAMALMMWLKTSNKLASGLVIGIVLAGAITFMPPSWSQRMATLNTYDADESATDRLTMWDTALRLALARPLTGAGFMGPYTRSVVDDVNPDSPARAVHSIWFEVLGEHGFPTFFVWLALTLVGVINGSAILRAAKGVPYLKWACDLARMTQVSIVAYLVAGSFLSLSYWDVYLTILVVIAATRGLVAQALASDAPDGRKAAEWRGGATSGAPWRHGVGTG